MTWKPLLLILGGLAGSLTLAGCSSHPVAVRKLEVSASIPIEADAIAAGKSPIVAVSARYSVEWGGSPRKGD